MPNSTETVIITGASTGIGLATARLFLERGANLVLNSINAERLQSAYEELGAPENTVLVPGDVSDKAVGARLAEAAVEEFDRIDVLVNSAGVFSPKPFLDVEEAELDRFYGINLKGTYLTTQAVVPAMRRQSGGSVVNVGTVLVGHALGGVPASAPVASKGAIHALTVQLAAEFGQDNIRFNTIAPGIVRTPIHPRNGIEDMDQLAGLHLLGRIGEAEEAAEAIVHLATASFTTGTIYALDGGHTAGHHVG